MKILVGVDGSESSTRAVEWCAQHATQLDAEVVAVHAIDLPVIASPMSSVFALPDIKPADREELMRIASEEWCAPLDKASVPCRVVLEDSEAARSIIRVARAENADLVVTGRRGRGGFAELLLGSTSHALSHHLPGPLLIVP